MLFKVHLSREAETGRCKLTMSPAFIAEHLSTFVQQCESRISMSTLSNIPLLINEETSALALTNPPPTPYMDDNNHASIN